MAFDSLIGGGNSPLDTKTVEILQDVLNKLPQVQSVVKTTASTTIVGKDSAGNTVTTVLPGQVILGTTAPPVITNTGSVQGTSGTGVIAVSDSSGTLGSSNSAVTQTQVDKAVEFIFKNTDDPAFSQAATDLFLAAVTNAANIVAPKAAGASLETLTLVQSAASSTSTDEVKVIGNTGSEKNLLALDIRQVADNKFVALENIENAVIVGSGSVRVSGNTNAVIAGDNASQVIVGGGGNDTLVGGGGSDTLNGGAGNDVYGLTGGSESTVRIEGFESNKDKIAFKLAGVTDFTTLKAAVSKVDYIGGNIVASFKDGSVVTLVGVTPQQLVEGLFSYSI